MLKSSGRNGFEKLEGVARPSDEDANWGPVFIVGVPRSGTTLLINLLATHTLLAPIYETRFLRNLLFICEDISSWNQSMFGKVPLIGDAFVRSRLRASCEKFRKKIISFGVTPPDPQSDRQPYESFPFGHGCILYSLEELAQETMRWLTQVQSGPLSSDDVYRTARDFVERLFALHCARLNRPRWVNKTPGLLNYLHLLAKLFPGARCINIIRDGRDVAVSNLSLSWGP